MPDVNACNYDENATDEDGTCTLAQCTTTATERASLTSIPTASVTRWKYPVAQTWAPTTTILKPPTTTILARSMHLGA